MQVCEKVERSRFTLFFQWFVAPEGRKVGSLKRRVRSHVARWEIKNCTPLWREAHFQVKMCKTHQVRSTLEIETSEKCTPLWREAHFEVKSGKNCGLGALLDVRMSFCVAGTRDSAPCQKVSKTWGFCSSFNYNRHTILHSTTLQLQLQLQLQPRYISLHYTALHKLHYTTLHYTQPNALRYTTTTTTTTNTIATTLQLHYTTLH